MNNEVMINFEREHLVVVSLIRFLGRRYYNYFTFDNNRNVRGLLHEDWGSVITYD